MICYSCKEDKEVSQFVKADQSKKKGTCKACYRLQRKAHYYRHKERNITAVQERKRSLQTQYKSLRNTMTCSLCPESDPCTLDFHHLDPKSKDFNVSQAATFGYSWETIQLEIAKCLCVCKNCHTKIHKYGLDTYRKMLSIHHT